MPTSHSQPAAPAQPTPGPWMVLWGQHPETAKPELRIVSDPEDCDNEVICVLEGSDARDEANANLLAAAPTMLKALRALMPFENLAVIGDGTGTRDDEIRQRFALARAAIAAAEGGTD